MQKVQPHLEEKKEIKLNETLTFLLCLIGADFEKQKLTIIFIGDNLRNSYYLKHVKL
jgi:hypothetical protein